MKRAPFLLVAPIVLVAVIGGAAALRLVRLDNRPMHCDEAVHAVKFGRLLEEDDYVYDPREYHGPSLNFLTLPIAHLARKEQLTEITETHLRLLPAVFGIALVALVWLVRDELGRPAALCAAALTAVSPAMVFYSRYYIQEMLLVCFTFAAMAALWRYARPAGEGIRDWGLGIRPAALNQSLIPNPQSPRALMWLVMLGVCVGMMHASKETCVIALGAMIPAAVLTIPQLRRLGIKRLVRSGLVAGLTAAGVSALFFSSFLDNPRGVVDSLTTYFVYLGRASGEGSVGRHEQAWPYYFRILFWWQCKDGPVWSEASIAALALVGAVAAAAGFSKGKGIPRANLPMARFLAVYTVLMTVVYSALPYKTPWCALGLLHGMILLGGVGAAVLVRIAPGSIAKTMVIALLVAAAGHLGWQAWRASFVAYEDPNNPYVYAHTTGDVPRLVERVEQISAVVGDARAMPIQVICPDADHWPLPWYLRGFRRVDWFPGMPHGRAAPLIITQPEMEPALAEYLMVKQPPGQRHLYVPVLPEQADRDWQLRPNVPLRVYVQSDLWNAYQAAVGQGLP